MLPQGDWMAAWNMLGVLPPDPEVYDHLVTAYAAPERAYHNLWHLKECFDHYNLVADRLRRPAEVALALWFHDVVYDSRRPDNEILSAAWADNVLCAAGCHAETIRRVHALILTTTHRTVPEAGDPAYLADIDLAILGADAERFAEYEVQIREEYRWVDSVAFDAGRADFLSRMLARPTIFATPYFRDRLERAARRNIAHSIASHRRTGWEG